MSDVDPKKLKVTELRAELQLRGLDTKGNKNVLVKRLQTALNKESGIHGDQNELEITQDDDSQEDTSTCEVTDNSAVDLEGAEEDGAAEEQSMDAEDSYNQYEDAQSESFRQNKDPETIPAVTEEIKEEDIKPVISEVDTSKPIPVQTPPVTEIKVEKESKEDDHRGRKRKHSRSRSRSRHRSRSGSRNRSNQQSHSRSHDRDKDREHQRPSYMSPGAQAVKLEEELPSDENAVVMDQYNSDLNLIIEKGCYSAHPLTEQGYGFMWAGARCTYGVTKGKICFETKVLEHMNVDHLPPDEPDKNVVRVGFSIDDTSMQLGEEPFSYGFGGTGKASTSCKFVDFGQSFVAGDVVGSYVDMISNSITISYTKNGNYLGIAFHIKASELKGRALFPHVLSKNCSFEINFGQRETPYFPIREGYKFIHDVPLQERVRGALPPKKREDCEIIMMCGLPGAGKSTWADQYSAKYPEKKFNIMGTNNIIDKMKVMGLPRKRNYAGRWDVLIDLATKCLNKMIAMGAKKRRNYILDQTNVYATAQKRKLRPFEGFQRKAVVLVPTDEEFRIRIAKREKEEGKDVPESAVLEMKANFSLPVTGPIFKSVEYVELPEVEAAKLVDQYRKEGQQHFPPAEKRFRPNERRPFPDRRNFSGDNRRGPPPSGRGSFDRDRGRSFPPPRNWGSGGGGGGSSGSGGGGGGYDRYSASHNSRGMSGPPRGGSGGYRDNRDSRGPPPRDNRGSGGNMSNYNSRNNYPPSRNSGMQSRNNYGSGSSVSSSQYGGSSGGQSSGFGRREPAMISSKSQPLPPSQSKGGSYGQSSYSYGQSYDQEYGSDQNYSQYGQQSYSQQPYSNQSYNTQSYSSSTSNSSAPSSNPSYSQPYSSQYNQQYPQQYQQYQQYYQQQSTPYAPQYAQYYNQQPPYSGQGYGQPQK